MKTIVKKVWQGYVEVRDNIVEGTISRNEDLVIELQQQGEIIAKMTIPVDKVKDYKRLNDQPIESKYQKGDTYNLCGYLWKPDKE